VAGRKVRVAEKKGSNPRDLKGLEKKKEIDMMRVRVPCPRKEKGSFPISRSSSTSAAGGGGPSRQDIVCQEEKTKKRTGSIS